MLAFAKFIVLGFVVSTVIYVSLWLYLRARRRELLVAEWEQDGRGEDLEDFVDKALVHYDLRRRRLLLLFVYVLPLVAIVTIIYRTNF
jgi:hypothetical protein